MNKKMNILFVSDQNYLMLLAVAIMSLKQKIINGQMDIYVITDVDEQNSKWKQILQLQEERVHIYFCKWNDEWMRGYKFEQFNRINQSTLYGLFLDQALPETVERVMFLDTDIVVHNDLSEVYNLDLEDKLIASGGLEREDVEYLLTEERHLLDYFSDEQELFDNFVVKGLLIIDVNKYRELHIGDKCLDVLKYHPECIGLDQDALTIVCKGMVKHYASRWFQQWRRVVADGSAGTGCTRTTIEDVGVIHYCTSYKPWTDPEYKLADEFWKVSYDTEWYPEIVEEFRRRTVQRVFRYRFPWNCVNAGEEIFIYGAGVVGRCYLEQLKWTQYCKVEGVIDKNADNMGADNIVSLHCLEEIYSDQKIVVAIKNPKTRETVAQELFHITNDWNKIVIQFDEIFC